MSGDSTAMAAPAGGAPREAGPDDRRAVLEALADVDCRAILLAAGTEALTASECSAALDLPLSTTYRKLELLVEAGLLSEHLRVRPDGKHANQYRRDFGQVCVAVDEERGLRVDVGPPDGTAPGETDGRSDRRRRDGPSDA